MYYLLQFIIGGGTVIGMSLMAKYVDAKYAGIIYALPVILIVSTVFIYLDQGLAVSQKAIKSTFIYEFTMIYFTLAFWLLLYKVDFWWALILALLSWALFVALIQFYVKI